jgi:hypothetical protein
MCLCANTRAAKFYKFGPTPDNPVDHLYEFSFNGETGAEFSGNEVILHFVDGKRGDSDLTKNGIIVDPGTPAIKASNAGASSGGGGGCSLHSGQRHPGNAGDWLLLFALMMLLYLRNRKHGFIYSRQGGYSLLATESHGNTRKKR